MSDTAVGLVDVAGGAVTAFLVLISIVSRRRRRRTMASSRHTVD